MKTLRKELQFLVKSLKSLTEKTEKIAEQLNEIERLKGTKSPTPRGRKAAAKKKTMGTATETVLKIIKRRKRGIDTATLVMKTNLDTKTIRNVIFRLKKQGKIVSKTRGVYVVV